MNIARAVIVAIRSTVTGLGRPVVWATSLFVLQGVFVGCLSTSSSPAGDDALRVMTYNIEDVRTGDLREPDHPRLQRAAARIQHLEPDVLLINEISYDQSGTPGYDPSAPEGENARRFVDHYLATPQADTLAGLSYETVMLPVNTGLSSGFDLNNDGQVITEMPDVPASPADGSIPPQTDAGRAYGNDAWGFGTFPGQYGMALLVKEDLTVLRDSIRTFRLVRWRSMPNASVPVDSTSFTSWYAPDEWKEMRLSSKSHWDVPVQLSGEAVVHVLASHPTPPAFDGPARRNARRNHDEVRFWTHYLNNAPYVRDDSGRAGGLPEGASFVVMGDQNADPSEPSVFRDAIRHLIGHERVNGNRVPRARPGRRKGYPDLDPDDTARWGKRVDYVLPSVDLPVLDDGVWRPDPEIVRDSLETSVSDHFPVWIDVRVGP